MKKLKAWIVTAMRRDIRIRSAAVSLIVGPLLILINQGDILWSGEVTGTMILKAALTMAVPYCVATFGGVSAVLRAQAAADAEDG